MYNCWCVCDADEFYSVWVKGDRNVTLKKKNLVIRIKIDWDADNDDDSIMLVPQKSFETFESALQWCEIRADTKKEILLHDYQKKKMHVTDESFIDTLNMIEIDNGSM